MRNGIPYAIDFCNPAPDADVHSVGQENFEWIVEHAAKFAIEKALDYRLNKNNCTWGAFLSNAISPLPRERGKMSLKTAAEAKNRV